MRPFGLRLHLRYGARSAIRTPVFSLLAVTTLALGIGANAAVFGVVKSVLLDALPYADADRVMRIYGRRVDGSNDRSPMSAGTAMDIATRQRSFVRVAAFEGRAREAVYAGEGNPIVTNVLFVEPGLFPTLGVPAALGRLLREESALLFRQAGQEPAQVCEARPGEAVTLREATLTIEGVSRTARGIGYPSGIVIPDVAELAEPTVIYSTWSRVVLEYQATVGNDRAIALVEVLRPRRCIWPLPWD